MRLSKIIRDLFKFLALFILAVTVMLIAIYFTAFHTDVVNAIKLSETVVQASTNDTFKVVDNSYVFDKKWVLLSKNIGERDTIYLKSYDIPDKIKNITIGIEDKRFREHGGVDFLATGRVIKETLVDKKIGRGASTITQQLAKNTFLSNEVTIRRKVKEMLIAFQLESKYTKAEILEFYLNSVNYGGNVHGIGTASKKYFSKSVDKLTLAEIVYLAGIPQNPSQLNPLKGTELGVARKNILAEQLYNSEVITLEEKNEILNEEIVLNPDLFIPEDYLSSYAQDTAVKKVMEMEGFKFRGVFSGKLDYAEYMENYRVSYEDAKNVMTTKGYRILTSLDIKMQNDIQDIATKHLKDSNLETAIAVVEVNTGLPVVVVGGKKPNEESTSFNRATQMYRQPGSAVKPVLLYAPYLDREGVSLNTILPDTKEYKGVRNHNNKYQGKVTVLDAIRNSKNTTAVWVLEQLGIEKAINDLEKYGWTKVVGDYNIASALGGMTYGCTPLELAGSYATLGSGAYQLLDPVMEVRTTDGIVYERPKLEVTDKAWDTEEITVALREVMTSGTGRRFYHEGVVGKTGTTSDVKDKWMAGYSEDYAVVVWVGYDKPETIKDTNLAGYLWKDVMKYLDDAPKPKLGKPIFETVDEEGNVVEKEKKVQENIGNTKKPKKKEEKKSTIPVEVEIHSGPEGNAVTETEIEVNTEETKKHNNPNKDIIPESKGSSEGGNVIELPDRSMELPSAVDSN